MKQMSGSLRSLALFSVCAICATTVRAEMSAEELAKLAQNPVGNLISVPFQNNTNLNYGPEKGTQNILNIQPVIPISVDNDWNIITRTILPVISQPALSPEDSRTNGIGDLEVAAGRVFALGITCPAKVPQNGPGPGFQVLID